MISTAINHRNIIINSSVLFVLSATLEMMMHEGGHSIAALIAGAKQIVLYHNYVTDSIDGISPNGLIFINAAGPNVSLLTGLIFHYLCYTHSTRNLFFLFCLYMSVFGYIGCFGYLMVAPFFIYGDTGYIAYLLGSPMWLTVILAVFGAFLLFILMKNLTRYYVEMGTRDIISDNKTRRTFINSLMLYPLLIGILVTTLLNLPSPTFLSLLAPICSPFAIMWTYGYAVNKKYPEDKMNTNIRTVDRIEFLWVVVLLLVININRMLVTGLIIN